MKTQFNLTTCACDLDRFSDQQALLRLMHGFDGVELMCFEDDARGIVPRERVIGLHMNCLTYWLDFWEGRLDACVQELDSMENVRRMYGGDTREALLAHYRRDLENAKKYGAEYVVFHVTDASIPETLRCRFHRTDAEVIDASCELLNLLFDGMTDGPALLLENLWEPGLTMTDPEMTARLLDGVRYANKGISRRFKTSGRRFRISIPCSTATASSARPSAACICSSPSRGAICAGSRKTRRNLRRTIRGVRTSFLSMCSGSISTSPSPARACRSSLRASHRSI